MTDERKDEIWAMLPEETKQLYHRIYGAEANWRSNTYGNGYCRALTDIFGYRNLTAQAEKKSNLSNSVNVGTNWNEYRLDLTKEITVALIPIMHGPSNLASIGKSAVEMANSIVKLLKETEE